MGNIGSEAIAIVGIGCRFANNASSPSKLWDMLKEGRSGQSNVPKNRFNVDSWYSPVKGRPGSIYSKGGYFLSHDDDYRNFDPSFFGISPLEATSMDPQQRKLLEVVYECFESAGKTLEDVSGSDTACFVGCFSHDYADIQNKEQGAGLTILSNRVNYVFNLKGASMTVDTACSSSLYALHLACQSLLAGDCTSAIVGGSSIIVSVEKHLGSGRLGILSPTSTCHTFDASADGFGRGDGIAAIYIKRLSAATKDGDPIRAIIRATAVNSNGKGLGLNHPGVEAQEAVIRKAYEKANLDFTKTGYFECHGTGTPVGDPIECSAIGNIFSEGRSSERPLLIGSVKTNLGHCEGASGLAAVIKAILCLEHACIPPTVGVARLNPSIDFRDGCLKVVQTLTSWPEWQKYRRASVNGFGYGGANAHVILDSADSFLHTNFQYSKISRHPSTPDPKDSVPKTRYLLTFSAHDAATLENNAKAVTAAINEFKVSDIAFTLANRRSNKLGHRSYLIRNHNSSYGECLRTNLISPSNPIPGIAFVFTDGHKWDIHLFNASRFFDALSRNFKCLSATCPILLTFSLKASYSLRFQEYISNSTDVLSEPKDSSSIYHSVRSPVCCTAIQVALVTLLSSWGVHPTAVVGHSAGEIASAFAAGRLTGAEAVTVAYYRGLAVLAYKEDGAMLAVGLGAEDVQVYIDAQPEVVIGCYNSPHSVTLSGKSQAIEEIRIALVHAGTFARKVNSSGNAYHSPLMNSAAQEFQRLFEDIYSTMVSSSTREIRLPQVPMYSCITNELIEIDTPDFRHWQMNLVSPVLFDQATQKLLSSLPVVDNLIEIGPHSALASPIKQIASSLGLDQSRLGYLPTLIRGHDGVDDLLNLAGTLFALGYPIDINRVNFDDAMDRGGVTGNRDQVVAKFLVDLPGYQWNYETLFWKDKRLARELRFRKHCRHDLLGSRDPGSTQNSPSYRNKLRLSDVPWLRDHKASFLHIGDNFIFPAAGYIALAIEAITQEVEDKDPLWSQKGYKIQNLKITSALIIPDDEPIEIVLNLREIPLSKSSSSQYDFCVSSVTEEGKWSEHAGGKITLVASRKSEKTTLAVQPRLRSYNVKAWYASLSTAGVTFGPTFQTLSDISTLPDKLEAVAKINFRTTEEMMPEQSRYIIHPTTLDGCLQLSVVAASVRTTSVSKAFLPVSIDEFTIWNSALNLCDGKASILARGDMHGLRSIHGSAEVFDHDGNLLIQGRMTFLSLEGGLQHQEVAIPRQPYTRLVWKPDIDRLGVGHCLKFDNRDGPATTNPRSENFPLADYMELIVHKGKLVDILHIGYKSAAVIAESLRGNTVNPLYKSYLVAAPDTTTSENAEQTILNFQNMKFCVFDLHLVESQKYDLVMLSDISNTIQVNAELIERCKLLLKANGRLLIDETVSSLTYSEWEVLLGEAGLKIYVLGEPQTWRFMVCESVKLDFISRDLDKLWLVFLEARHPLHDEIAAQATRNGVRVESVSLLHVLDVISPGSTIILTGELERSVLTELSSETLVAMQYLVKNVSLAIWITNGGILDGINPEKSLASGFAKTLMTEQPSFRLSCFDVDPSETNFVRSATNILDHYHRLTTGADPDAEANLAESNGVVYISRLIPDEVENLTFERVVNPPIEPQPLDDGLELDFTRVGHAESFYFRRKEVNLGEQCLMPNEVLLEPSLYSLNANEASVLVGQQGSEFFSHETVANVRDVGCETDSLRPGDRVLCLSPGKFDSSFKATEELCYRLLPEDNPEEFVGAILPMCSALYTLHHVGGVRPQEAILLHLPGNMELKLAFAQLVRHKKIKIFVTYSQQLEKQYLEEAQIPENCLVLADSAEWTESIKHVAESCNFSAIITSSTTSCHGLWNHVKKNGKCVFLGTRSNFPDLSTTANSVFTRSASLTLLDILDIFGEEMSMKKLVKEAFDIYRDIGYYHLHAPIIFDISEFGKAISSALSPDSLGKAIIRYEPVSKVPIHVVPTHSVFDSCATFLMIGCLGGLGRSLVRWMASRGARHFIFLSRSGAEKPETLAFLEELRCYADEHQTIISSQVIAGDVSLRKDVDKAIESAKLPIRGVIQAAAVFGADLFEDMTTESFNAVLNPKVQGTINLHEALIHEPLDFFVMTSSTLGLKGSATQSHYAAGNAFMDSMARHRWSLGLQATSLALGLVQGIGHINDNPEMEESMLQNGLYMISEAEYLLMMELACQPRSLGASPHLLSKWDKHAGAHIVTGLEASRMDISSFLSGSALMGDQRFRCLNIRPPNSNADSVNASKESDSASILAAAMKSGGEIAMKDAMRDIVLGQFSKLVLVPTAKLQDGLPKPLTDFGMDSMISSEIRAIAWNEFRADIPFMKILEKGLLLGELIDLIWEKITKPGSS
ncbi:hypothetical protein B0O99DRAFT_692539 [Bisporella sp. PMI_857]|nr:hypothetical protein B0O99DRAFT_692539 [Bisporella sp. PMI_857]